VRDRNHLGRGSCALIFLIQVGSGRLGGTADESPFARVPGTHVARLTVVPHLEGPGRRPDERSDPHLLIAADAEGPAGRWLDAFLAYAAPLLVDVMSCCVGWPGSEDRWLAARWLGEHRLDAGFSVVAYPDAKVAEVVAALALRERLGAFAVSAQAMSPTQLRDSFHAEFGASPDGHK